MLSVLFDFVHALDIASPLKTGSITEESMFFKNCISTTPLNEIHGVFGIFVPRHERKLLVPFKFLGLRTIFLRRYDLIAKAMHGFYESPRISEFLS